MKTPDINSLVTGILTVIGIAIAIGQYGRLEAWARRQAMEAMLWDRGLPHFFAAQPAVRNTKVGKHRAHHTSIRSEK